MFCGLAQTVCGRQRYVAEDTEIYLQLRREVALEETPEEKYVEVEQNWVQALDVG
jgi:hypothetical protein